MHSSKGHFVPPIILQRSRELRHPLTPSEAKVWHAVRSRQLRFKVRRQQPIGRFILDFYCAEARLDIEIDGDIHADPDQALYDAARTAWLEDRGYAVIRFDAREFEQPAKPGPVGHPSPSGRGAGGEGERPRPGGAPCMVRC